MPFKKRRSVERNLVLEHKINWTEAKALVARARKIVGDKKVEDSNVVLETANALQANLQPPSSEKRSLVDDDSSSYNSGDSTSDISDDISMAPRRPRLRRSSASLRPAVLFCGCFPI